MFNFVESMMDTGKLSYEDVAVNKGMMKISMLRKGFGVTIGNAVRRVLLSSIPGIAIVGVKFGDVLHEFSSVSGVKEDISDIILNLKSVRFKCEDFSYHDYDGKTIEIDVKGAKVITSADIDDNCPAGLSVVDKSIYLFSADSGTDIQMKLYISSGVGYVVSAGRNDPIYYDINRLERISDVSRIDIDPCFSCVKKASFEIHHSVSQDNSAVGNDVEREDLILSVETDGSVTPENACEMAVAVLRTQLSIFSFVDVVKEDKPLGIPEDSSTSSSSDLEEKHYRYMARRIYDLELSVRSLNCLKTCNIVYIGELICRSEADILQTPNFGRKSLREIKDLLSQMGLRLGMNICCSLWSKHLASTHSTPHSERARSGSEVDSGDFSENSD